MKQTHSHKALLFLAILVTIFVAIVYGYMYHMIDVFTERTIDARGAIQKANSLSSKDGKNYLSSYKTSIEKWTRLKELFVPSDEVVDFIESIESLDQQTGSKIALASIDADKLDDATFGTKGTIRVKVNATGSWYSVMHVLSLAEVLPYKISISNVRIDRYTSSSDESSVKGNQVNSGWKLSFDIEAVMIVSTTTAVTSK
ncbi:MAG: hypothetical protein WC666_04380 [Candidatus Paceibacterota bacterium]|jgi:hypothetical protein